MTCSELTIRPKLKQKRDDNPEDNQQNMLRPLMKQRLEARADNDEDKSQDHESPRQHILAIKMINHHNHEDRAQDRCDGDCVDGVGHVILQDVVDQGFCNAAVHSECAIDYDFASNGCIEEIGCLQPPGCVGRVLQMLRGPELCQGGWIIEPKAVCEEVSFDDGLITTGTDRIQSPRAAM